MSKRISRKEVFAIISQADIKPSDELVAEVRNKYENDPDIFTDVPACRKEDGFMKKRILISAGAVCALLVMGVCLVLFLGNNNKAYADYYSYEQYDLNTTTEVSEEFVENQNQANRMFTRFVMEKLPYQGKYKAPAATGEYTVDGNRADVYPDYFGGTYINVDGKLIVTIKDSYFDKRYRESDWYKELAKMLGSEDFACRPVKYNYTELVNGMSDVVFGSFSEMIKETGVEVVGIGLNDYKNQIVIYVQTEEDAEKINSVIATDLYSTEVVGVGLPVNSIKSGDD